MRALVWGALLLGAVAAHAPTADPGTFEAAFQGRCGLGSPCEQLCRELHDGTFECGCGPGYLLHVDGYGCMQLNSTKTTDSIDEELLYQKDVSFSAELEIAPNILADPNFLDDSKNADTDSTTQTLPQHISWDDKLAITAEESKKADGITRLIDDGVSRNDLGIIADGNEFRNVRLKVTTLGPSLEQKVPSATVPPPWTAAVEKCTCDRCIDPLCDCYQSSKCANQQASPSIPRFAGASWMAFHALRGAYKRVRIHMRIRPERGRGVLLLTGEHDDLSGDYLALVLRQGRVELRYDCGSGAGILRSPEPIRLGHWNTISIYRHRWDAWLRVNNGKRVRGRSKGLFSRMTFREPVWVGAAGNTTGLQTKLGIAEGFLGCVDYLHINGKTYNLATDAVATTLIDNCAPTFAAWMPHQDETTQDSKYKEHGIYDINDIVHFEDNDLIMRDGPKKKVHQNGISNFIEPFKQEIKTQKYTSKTSDKTKILVKTDEGVNRLTEKEDGFGKAAEMKLMGGDEKCKCQHGGGCFDGGCLCPLGYAGVYCEITLDLKVPRFNGSSYLRLPGLGVSALHTLNIQLTLKAASGNGLVLYNADLEGYSTCFVAIHLRDYYVEFAYNLGTGMGVIRADDPIEPNRWYRVVVNRTGGKAVLGVRPSLDTDQMVIDMPNPHLTMYSPPGPSKFLSVRGPMLLGGSDGALTRGALHLDPQGSFDGCVRALVINEQEISIVSSALGGVNVDNCDKADTCTKPECKETYTVPEYPSDTEIHRSIVPKKGPKGKRRKTKKHALKDERTKNLTALKANGGQDLKYLVANEINWGDTNTYPSFIGDDSFIHIDDDETMKRLQSTSVDINIRFRSSSAWGLLVWSGRTPTGEHSDFMSLALEDSVLVFRYNLGSGEVVIVANNTKVDDGLWHRARATRNGQAGVLEVDGLGSVGKISPGSFKQLNTDNGLYIGGLPSIEINTRGKYKTGLIGCVSQISLSGDFDIPLSLSKLPHTITNNVGRCTPY